MCDSDYVMSDFQTYFLITLYGVVLADHQFYIKSSSPLFELVCSMQENVQFHDLMIDECECMLGHNVSCLARGWFSLWHDWNIVLSVMFFFSFPLIFFLHNSLVDNLPIPDR